MKETTKKIAPGVYLSVIGGMLPKPLPGCHFEDLGFFRLLKPNKPGPSDPSYALPGAGPVMGALHG
jgi:hypothetical protein